MLKILECTSRQDKSRARADFDVERGSWIVSDLQSKWNLQAQWLKQRGVLEDQTVMRATELWSHLAFQLRPDLNLLSMELAQSLFWTWIEPKQLSWARSPRAVQVVVRQMQQWMGLFTHPNYRDVMGEWFIEHKESYLRWGAWFELCAEIWERCQEQNLMMTSWLPALLLNEDLGGLKWERNLVFDLGPQITPVEGLLIQELARHKDVQVLLPTPSWRGLLGAVLDPYRDMIQETEAPPALFSKKEHLQFGRFASQLAEAKGAVAQVRQWLDQGVKPNQIAVIAPDIEKPWPTLRLYLQEEGIPANKSVSTRLGAFPEMAEWMAQIKVALGQVDRSSLEVALFVEKENPKLTADEFRILFTNIYGPEDLNRAENLFKQDHRIDPNALMSLLDFVAWALRYWRAPERTERLDVLLQKIGQEVPASTLLPALEWANFTEGLLARRDVELKSEQDGGIWCVSLGSANWLEVTHAVVLNLCESELRELQPSLLKTTEAQQITRDTGLALVNPDRQELEFELLWLIHHEWTQLNLSFSESDFDGQALTPSRLWIWLSLQNGAFEERATAPQKTRWDQIQSLPLEEWAKVRQVPQAQLNELRLSLQREQDISISTWKPLKSVRLSASSCEAYLKCPFIFAAQRQLKLSDDPVLDLDLDYRSRGKLLHAALKELLERSDLNWSESELSDLLDRLRGPENIRVGEERLWPGIRKQHIDLCHLFLKFEKAWREKHPTVTTVARESDFKVHWDFATQKPTLSETNVLLSGRLDRVDQDSSGRYGLVDYKSGGSGLTNWGSWLENDSLQMTLYAWLLELGLVTLPASPTVAAQYFVVKESERKKGFVLESESVELFESEGRAYNKISHEQKDKLYSDVSLIINNIAERTLHADLNPNPKKVSTCTTCSWRSLCRAPHLN